METKVTRNQDGITIITVVITITVLIILAAISITNINTQQRAALAKYVQEFEEVRKGVEAQRLVDSKENVANADSSFSKVYVSGDVPYNFLTLTPESDSNQKMAYLVNLNIIGYDELVTGQDYPKFEQGTGEIKTVTFGKDDVYVYDSAGRLFYAKGYVSDGKTYYENTNSNDSIKILNVDIAKKGEETVTITVTIESVNNIKKVTIGGQQANGLGDKKYSLDVKQNGTYEIVAEDEKGNVAKERIYVSGIESSSAPVVTAEVTNGVPSDGVYKITENVAHIKLTSNTAKTLYIGTSSSDVPTTWLPYSETIDRYYSTSGIKDLYIYVKDENNTSCVKPCHLQISVELPEIPGEPTIPQENVTFGEIEFLITKSEPSSDEWSRTKYVQIIYPEGKQSDGYSSMYRISTDGGTKFGRWTVSYERIMNLEITQDTVIEAKIVYKSARTNKESTPKPPVTVDKIDRKGPKINSLIYEDDMVNKRTLVKGTALDYESGINSNAYFISMENIDFSDGKNVDKYQWSSTGEFKVIKDGKYYFYARDNVNNVSVSSINVNVIDRTPPVIKSISSIPALGQVTIRATAQDETGIVAFALTSTEVAPTVWNEINEQEYVVVESIVKTEGTYYMWVKDAAGNMNHTSTDVKPYVLPVVDSKYPQDLYIMENKEATFETKITTPGFPEKCEYEWQVSNDSGVTWQTIGEQTGSTYKFTAKLDDNGKLYKCLIKHEIGTIESRIAKLEVVKITNNKPGVEVIEDKEMILGGVMINNGSTTTQSTKLSLEVVALNAYEMNISESNTKTEDWQKYEQNIEYDLKDVTPGEKTIYVWIRDANGNESNNPVTAKITLKK